MPLSEEGAREVVASVLAGKGHPPFDPRGSEDQPFWQVVDAVVALIPYLKDNAVVKVPPHPENTPSEGVLT